MSVPGSAAPLVTVLLTTHERPRFLPIALACFQHQTHSPRELIVVDDGDKFPVAEAQVRAAGGRFLRMPAGTPLGIKLNAGAELARGSLILKMDDDDWYAPGFLDTMVAAYRSSPADVCRRTVAGVQPFLFFDVLRWNLRLSPEFWISGATLLFARDDWQAQPFRPVPRQVDTWFIRDQVKAGVVLLAVAALERFLQVRHAGHLWTQRTNDGDEEEYLRRPQYDRRPEELLPDWAVRAYREIQADLGSRQSMN